MCIRNMIDLVYINAYTKFYQNSSISSEDIEEKHIFTSIKGHNSVVYGQIYSICNPKPLLPDINVHAKFEENRSKTTQVRVGKGSADRQMDGGSNCLERISYRIMGYFCVAKFSRFYLKNMGLFFAGFNFCGRKRPRKIISIFTRKNCRVGDSTRLSLDRSTVRKQNLRPKYLNRKVIKDTCSLTDKQTKITYLHSNGLIKWLFRTK